MSKIIYTNNAAFNAVGIACMNACDAAEIDDKALGLTEPVIVISNSFNNAVASDVMAIMLSHEEGHIALGHCKLTEGEGTYQGLGADAINGFEIAADGYAATIHGAAAVLSALELFVETYIEVNFGDVVHDECFSDTLTLIRKQVSDSMGPRFDALRSLM